jgi:hypothetical protein
MNFKTHYDAITEYNTTEILFRNCEELRKSSVTELLNEDALMQDVMGGT